MITKARQIAFTAILAAASLSAVAQDTTTEVELRYKENPELRDFSKLSLTPAINLPAVTLSRLPYSSSDVRVTVPGSITTLETAAYADTIYSSPFRGYAALGFMTKYNLAASAGYKILDNDHTRLNAWLQFDGTAYKTQPLGDMTYVGTVSDPTSAVPMLRSLSKHYVRSNTATLGADLHQAVGRESFIDAGIDYTLSRYSFYRGFTDFDAEYQNLHRINVEMTWTLSHGGFRYGLGAGYHHFGFGNMMMRYDAPELAGFHAQRENRFTVNGFFNGSFAGASSAGIDVEMSHLSYPYLGVSSSFGAPELHKGGFNHTLLSLTPYYRFDINSFHLDLGARIDMTFNDGKFFHIAPHAQATWTPGDFAKIYIKAGGGEWQNTLGSLYDVSPYLLPFMSYHNSNIPVTAEVGVTVGSWKGLYAEFSATYAIANHWLMPLIGDYSDFGTVNLKGYKFRGAVGYRYRDIIDIRASYEGAPQKYNRGYYLWRDRAKSVAEIGLVVRPIKALDLNIGWEYRGGRRTYFEVADFAGFPDLSYYKTPQSLRSVNNLKAGALYRINTQWSVFLTGENLLNRHHFLVSGEGAQGLTGLVGATYKF